ncbi:hypothetical protein ACFVGY_16390 [Streptomyces sp. NPDC127106]|uniref:hypothetical protein n=1 Tax=Streptomyces sp. NPDC127106 TaxID=3345360 RepID=UPI00363FB431
MNMKKRAGGVLAAVFAAAALPLLTAAPASADQGDCQYYLHEAGYNVGPKVEGACGFGASTEMGAFSGCYVLLVDIGVSKGDAVEACSLAGEA